MHCVNCRAEEEPAYTLRAHVDPSERAETETDGGEPVVDLRFCSFECLQTWT